MFSEVMTYFQDKSKITKTPQNILVYSKLPHGVALTVSDHPGVGEGKPATPGRDKLTPDISNTKTNKYVFWAH